MHNLFTKISFLRSVVGRYGLLGLPTREFRWWWLSLFLGWVSLLGVGEPRARAQNGPACSSFATTRSIPTGLGSNNVQGVYAVGSTVYAATLGGLSISTDGGT
ncbi:hypothetical protein, partial [Spirosoma validum]